MLQADTSRLAGSLLVALDAASGNRGGEFLAVTLLLIAAIVATVLLQADRVSARLLRTRAKRLPDDLAGRLLEEWLAEISRMSRAGKVAFALSLLLTPTSTLVQAASTDEADALARAVASGERQYVAASLARRMVASLGDFVFWSTIGLLPLLLVGALIDSPIVQMLAFNAAVVACEAWLVVRYGGNVGKLLTKLRVIAVDGGAVTARHALGRALPTSAIGMAPRLVALTIVVWSGADANGYEAMTDPAQRDLLRTLAPAGLMVTVQLAALIWFIADAFQAYRDPDHRSVHDLIGGTMVVYREPRLVGRPDTFADDPATSIIAR